MKIMNTLPSPDLDSDLTAQPFNDSAPVPPALTDSQTVARPSTLCPATAAIDPLSRDRGDRPSTPPLRAFTNPEVLHIIGHRRLALLFSRFGSDLVSAGLTAPILPDPDFPPTNGEYFDAAAALLGTPNLPERFSGTLATLERLAEPANGEALDAIIQRRLPCIALNRACPLDCALEVFFACPDELAPFSESSSSSC